MKVLFKIGNLRWGKLSKTSCGYASKDRNLDIQFC